jgi:hypothetical protein
MEPIHGLLYSQIGYDLGLPIRVIARSTQADELPEGSRFTVVDVESGEAVAQGEAVYWGALWHSHWWVADTSGLPEGTYRLSFDRPGADPLESGPFVVGDNLLWRETVVPVALEQMEARQQLARYGKGWKDCGAEWREANSHASTIIGLTDLLNLGFEHLSSTEVERLVGQIVHGCDYLVACQDAGEMAGLGRGAVAHGHFYLFPGCGFTEKANTHHHVGHDTGSTFPNYIVGLIELARTWYDHPDAPRWQQAIRDFAYGYFLPACRQNPFYLLPEGYFTGQGLLTFCGPWHGINTSLGYAAALAAQLEMHLGDSAFREIATGNLQWIAGLHAGITRESMAGCQFWREDIPAGEARAYSQISGVGRRSVGNWSGIHGTIVNGFSANPQFQLVVEPTRANDGPWMYTDEDWIPHSGGWLSGLSILYRLLPEHIWALRDTIESAAMVVLQYEVLPETLYAALDLAYTLGKPVLFNYAPARPLEIESLKKVALLVVNEVEAEYLCRFPLDSDAAIREAAGALRQLGPQTVVITLGSKGALVADGAEAFSVPAFPVQVVDTTAAGDVFCGVLAVALVEGQPLAGAVRFACAASAISVTRLGAQPSAPTREEIQRFLQAHPAE